MSQNIEDLRITTKKLQIERFFWHQGCQVILSFYYNQLTTKTISHDLSTSKIRWQWLNARWCLINSKINLINSSCINSSYKSIWNISAFAPVLFNVVIHVIMYSYYFFAALGPEFQKYLWWKKHLTKLQIVSSQSPCFSNQAKRTCQTHFVSFLKSWCNS